MGTNIINNTDGQKELVESLDAALGEETKVVLHGRVFVVSEITITGLRNYAKIWKGTDPASLNLDNPDETLDKVSETALMILKPTNPDLTKAELEDYLEMSGFRKLLVACGLIVPNAENLINIQSSGSGKKTTE